MAVGVAVTVGVGVSVGVQVGVGVNSDGVTVGVTVAVAVAAHASTCCLAMLVRDWMRGQYNWATSPNSRKSAMITLTLAQRCNQRCQKGSFVS